MVRTAINVYSVRELDVAVGELVGMVADAGYDGIQFSGRHTPMEADPDAVAEAVDDAGLGVTPPHVGIEALEDDRETAHGAYDPFDVGGAVVPYLGEEHFASAAAIGETAERLAALADDLGDEGWDLHYHNHAHEYVDLGDETGFDRFVDATDVGIELDVGWALVGGDDPVERLRSLGERAELVHMKDMDTSAERGFAEIGEGDVDMQACADAAREVGAEWLIYEHDDPDDPEESLYYGAEFLNDL